MIMQLRLISIMSLMCFFIANPFDFDIYEKVVDSIFSTLNGSRNDSRVWLVTYGAAATEYIRDKKVMNFIDSYIDKNGVREVNIWKWEKKE